MDGQDIHMMEITGKQICFATGKLNRVAGRINGLLGQEEINESPLGLFRDRTIL